MTNREIILENSIFLMQEGVIKGTGETITYKGESIECPEELRTFQEWKRRGYRVKKGEHSIARFPIWCKVGTEIPPSELADGEKQPEPPRFEKGGKMPKFVKSVAFFFIKSQVEPISQ